MAMQRYTGVVQDSKGNGVPGVPVTVRLLASGNIATLYSNEGTTAITNPITVGADGAYFFYAADGDYSIATPDSTIERVTLFSGIERDQLLRKADDLPTKNNDIAMANDSTLVFAMEAYQTWEAEAIVRITSAAAAGFKFEFAIPAGTTFNRHTSWLWDNTTLRGQWNSAMGVGVVFTYAGGVAALSDDVLDIKILIVNGANAGSCQLRYAQAVADVSDTEVLAGSWMTARRIG